MVNYDYLEPDLHSCKLCEWRCGVDRLAGELGVCGITLPLVASSQLHPAPPSSFDAFLIGCNYKCLFCQNWSVSMFVPDSEQKLRELEGYYKPELWAELAVTCLDSPQAQLIKADRLFFTGGEPTCSLPWVEEVVRAARELSPGTKVNFDTNGFLTKESLHRVLEFATSITYDLKAFDPDVFRALTGANVKPVLRNLKEIVKTAPDKLWEVRVMVIPGVHEHDVEEMCGFLADIDPKVTLNFLAFRPNFVMEEYFGATDELLEKCVKTAHEMGLENVSWSGRPNLPGRLPEKVKKVMKKLGLPKQIALPVGFARTHGCDSEPRNCGVCNKSQNCPIRSYEPEKVT